MKIGSIAKSLLAALAAGTAAAVTAAQDGTLTTGEGVTVALAVLGALGVVYAVPNKQSAPGA